MQYLDQFLSRIGFSAEEIATLKNEKATEAEIAEIGNKFEQAQAAAALEAAKGNSEFIKSLTDPVHQQVTGELSGKVGTFLKKNFQIENSTLKGKSLEEQFEIAAKALEELKKPQTDEKRAELVNRINTLEESLAKANEAIESHPATLEKAIADARAEGEAALNGYKRRSSVESYIGNVYPNTTGNKFAGTAGIVTDGLMRELEQRGWNVKIEGGKIQVVDKDGAAVRQPGKVDPVSFDGFATEFLTANNLLAKSNGPGGPQPPINKPAPGAHLSHISAAEAHAQALAEWSASQG